MHGFFNKVLGIDLSSRETRDEDVQERVYENLLGGKGLATRLLLDKNPAMVDPLSPENNLVFATGPLTDQRVHGSARFGAFTKSPLTGLYSESYAGGTAADRISRTGYDAIMVSGASESPVFLTVSDNGVEFHHARKLWGMDTHRAEQGIKERVGRSAGAVVIGPAGENLVRFANAVTDRWHFLGRTGIGAVMGSKNLKGIAFLGDKRRQAFDPDLLEKHWKTMAERSRSDQGVAAYKSFGTVQMVAVANEAGVFPTRYWELGKRDDYLEKLSGEAHHKRCKVQPRACPRCFMSCGKMSEVLEGEYKGLKMQGPEYETIYAFAGLCMVDTIEEVMHLNRVCDLLGMDTITAGNLLAFAMHASEKGAIQERIAFGHTGKCADLLGLIAAQEGIGQVLARGMVHAANEWGLSEDAVHVKGLEPAGYDPRPLKGMGLAYAVSDRGACHLRATFYKAEFSGMIPPDKVEGKAELFVDFEDRATLFDTLILCRFFRDLLQWEELGVLVRASTGMDLDKAGLKGIAANVTDLARRFNLREGMKEEDDRLPAPLLSTKLPPTNKSIKPAELSRMKADYYRIRGWDEKGMPRSFKDQS